MCYTNNMSYYNFFIKYFRPYGSQLTIVLLLLIMEAIFFSGASFSIKFILEALSNNNWSLLKIIITILILGGFLVVAFGVIRNYFYSRVAANATENIRKDIFKRISLLPMIFFIKGKQDSIRTSFDDTNVIGEFISVFGSGFISALLILIFNFILLIFLNWQMAILGILMIPLIFIGPQQISLLYIKQNELHHAKENIVKSDIRSNLALQSVIREFTLNNHMKNIFTVHIKELTEKFFLSRFYLNFVNLWGTNVTLLLELIILSVGVYAVYRKYLTIADLVAFQFVFSTLIMSATRIAYNFSALFNGISATKRVILFLRQTKSEKKDNVDLITKNDFLNNIIFDQIYFSYEKEYIILKNINITIAKGETIAFVGASGSGKSTLLLLLMQFCEPTLGKITLDEINFNHISEDSIHHLISYVSQEPQLFNISIRENIRYGKLDATQNEIEQAAKLAEIHDKIMEMPNGYDTPAGEGGKNLSSGEKQRIAIARAIIRKPAILLLDEITSALDPATEAHINQTMELLTKTCTSISVTHRLDSATHANKIFVVNHGEIVEQGTHYELMNKKGLYKTLWDKQHGFILKVQKSEAEITVERLRMLPIFSQLSDDLLKKICPLFKTVVIDENNIVIKEGEKGDLFYIIVYGKVKVRKKNRQFILEDGDHFGEIALMKEIPRTATIQTMVKSYFLVLHRDDFIHLLNDAPLFKSKVEKIIALRMKNELE